MATINIGDKTVIKCESAIQSQHHTVTVGSSGITFNIEVCGLKFTHGSINPIEQCSFTRTTAEYLLCSLGYDIGDIANLTTHDNLGNVTQEYNDVKVEPIDKCETKPHAIQNNTEIPIRIIRPEIRLVDLRLTHPYLFMEQLNETPGSIDKHDNQDHRDDIQVEGDGCQGELYENQGSEKPTKLSHENATEPNNGITACIQSVNHIVVAVQKESVPESDPSMLDLSNGNDTKTKPYKCSQCRFQCKNSTKLKEHRRIHTEEKTYMCNECSYSTARSCHLVVHKRIHTGEKPYTCNLCNYKTANSSHIAIHKKTHTGEKPYICNVCSYRTVYSHALVVHKRIHTGEKPYKCDVCSYRTGDLSRLRVHRRTHSGETPYKCTKCSYRAIKSSNVTRHMKCRHASPNP